MHPVPNAMLGGILESAVCGKSAIREVHTAIRAPGASTLDGVPPLPHAVQMISGRIYNGIALRFQSLILGLRG